MANEAANDYDQSNESKRSKGLSEDDICQRPSPHCKGKKQKGLMEYDFLADPSWEGFDSLVKYLQKYWQAEINESSDLVYSRRCVLISNGIPISVYHDSQLGNYFLREDGVDDTTLLDDIAKDLERHLSHTS